MLVDLIFVVLSLTLVIGSYWLISIGLWWVIVLFLCVLGAILWLIYASGKDANNPPHVTRMSRQHGHISEPMYTVVTVATVTTVASAALLNTADPTPPVSQTTTTATIEISFLGFTFTLENVNLNSEALNYVIGISVYLVVVTRVFSKYNAIKEDQDTLEALREAEVSFSEQIDMLYAMSTKIFASNANLIVFDDGTESEYNVFDKQITSIRESIIALQNKYRNKIDPRLAHAIDNLYKCTIIHPSDISEIKILADEVLRVGESTGAISREFVNEKITIHLSKSEK